MPKYRRPRSTDPPCLPAPATCRTTRRAAQGLGRFEFAACCAVVGVLLAVLLGRLGHWQSDARQLRLQTAMAAVNRAAAVFRSQCLVSRPPSCESLRIDGLAIAGVHGHAAASAEGVARLAGLPPQVRLRASTRDGVPSLTVDVASSATPPCEFTYVQAPHAGAASGIDPASVSCP